MGKPDAPQPINPYAVGAAQTSTNVGTAVANAYLNNINQVTPQGSLSYNQTGNYGWTDPSTNQTYNIPTFTATQTLSPQQQAIQGQTEAAQYNLAGMANAQSGRISDLLSTNVDISQAPQGGNAQNLNVGGPLYGYASGGPIQSSLGPYGQQQTTFGDAGPITNTYGPADNFSADRTRYEDALFARMNPQLQIERSNLEQRLNDQGIRYGSAAYTNAMDDYNRQANDARYGAIAQGGQEQQRMNQMAAQLAAFQNSAQTQAYTQAKGRGDFANEAQNQAYQQALGAGTFANQAQLQQQAQNAGQAQFYNQGVSQAQALQQSLYNAQQAQRNQYLQEQYQYRNQPLNEIGALLGTGAVSSPNFINTPGSQIPTTDMAGIMNSSFNQQQQNYQQQMASYNNLIGGVLGLGAGAVMKFSDERVKEKVDRVGTIFAAKADEPAEMGTVIGDAKQLPIYEYSYKGDPSGTRHVGPMAQDVEKIDKKAVKTVGGVKAIDIGRVNRMARMGSILKAA